MATLKGRRLSGTRTWFEFCPDPFGGVFGLEMVSSAILSSHGRYGFYASFYPIEELMESVGMVFILCVALKELSQHGRGSGFHPAVA